MLVLALSVSMASQVVGVLLIFTLIIAPGGLALRLCRTFWRGVLLSVALGVGVVWTGILAGCVTNWPPTFWITALFFVIYLGLEGYLRLRR
jgi:zinc/manganese transport system permease protein